MANNKNNLCRILQKKPHAYAFIQGGVKYPDIRGTVEFYQTEGGVLVVAEVIGLPKGKGKCDSPILGFHIHEGSKCDGNVEDEFANAGSHYNPYNCPHPYHAGDMPPLFSCGGYALQIFLTDRFHISQIVGGTIVIHSKPDDFTTQPSGNAGKKIACGEIVK